MSKTNPTNLGAPAEEQPFFCWRELMAGFHLDRARRHLDLLSRGDASEPHLAHTACRQFKVPLP